MDDSIISIFPSCSLVHAELSSSSETPSPAVTPTRASNMVKLEDIIQYGDMNNYVAYIERARRQGLHQQVTQVEQEMHAKRSEVSNWLTQAVHDWEADKLTLEKNIDEAKKIGLDELVTATEAAVSARRKVITESVEISIDKGLLTTYEHWIKHAERLGMEEFVYRSQLAFKEQTRLVKMALLEAATCGTREEFISASSRARSLGLAVEMQRCRGIVQKRVCDVMSGAAELATEAARTGVLQSERWSVLTERAQELGIGRDVLDHVVEEVLEGEGASLHDIASCSSSGCESDREDVKGTTSEEPVVEPVYVPVWSLIQNWKEVKQTRRNWQMEMVEEERSLPRGEEKRLLRSEPHHLFYEVHESAAPESFKQSPRSELLAEYESEEEKHDCEISPRMDENREMDAILSMPLILTRLTLEQKMNCSAAELRGVNKVDLNHEGLSSLGDGVISEWCPKPKSFTCDMNRLTTLRRAFLGCEKYLEHVSAKNNFISDVSELATLFNLETLRLDGNNISSLGQAGKSHKTAAETFMETNCWPKLRELSVSCNRITKVTNLGLLCPNLQVLDLGSNHLVTMGGPQGNALAGLRHLRVLDVGQNRLKGRSLWEALRNCPLLLSLVASRNRLTELPSFSGSALLRELWLNGNAIRRLSCIAWLPNLQRLYLQDNSIETLEPLWGCPVLEVLDLSFNSISDLSQLRQLACFLHLRTLQLNDNPVSEQVEYVETVLEAVPWLMELDNEAVSENSKNRGVKRIYLKVMGSIGMQYLHEKAARQEIIVAGAGKPDEVQKLLVGCRTHEKLSWFNNLHSESVISAGGHCQDSSCSGKQMVPLSVFRNGTASRATLWAMLFEATLFDSTRTALRRLAERTPHGTELPLPDDLEAKQDVFACIEMCFKQRERLLLANKDLSSEREVDEQPDEDSDSDSARRETSSSASFRRGLDDLEFCLRQHIEFHLIPRDGQFEFKYVAMKEESASRIQALIKGFLTRRRLQRHVRAVSRIQALWKGRKQRERWKFLNPWPDRKTRKAGIELVVKVQALWRAHALRKKLKTVLASSKYVDEDVFNYDEIDETEFFVGDCTVDSCMPDLIFSGINSRSSESLSDVPTGAELQALPDKASPRAPPTGKLQTETFRPDGSTVEIKNVQMAQIAKEWGFKDERTVKQFLKACRKGKKPTKQSKPHIQDAQKRLDIFKAKAEAPNESHQMKQHIEKIISGVNKRTDKADTPALGKSTPPPLEKDVVKPSVYLFGIPTH